MLALRFKRSHVLRAAGAGTPGYRALQVSELKAQLVAVQSKVSEVQSGVVVEHHKRIREAIAREKEHLRRVHEFEVKEMERKLMRQEATEQIRLQHELAAARAEFDKELKHRTGRVGTMLKERVEMLTEQGKELRTTIHGKDQEILMLTTRGKMLEAEVQRLTQELNNKKYAEAIAVRLLRPRRPSLASAFSRIRFLTRPPQRLPFLFCAGRLPERRCLSARAFSHCRLARRSLDTWPWTHQGSHASLSGTSRRITRRGALRSGLLLTAGSWAVAVAHRNQQAMRCSSPAFPECQVSAHLQSLEGQIQEITEAKQKVENALHKKSQEMSALEAIRKSLQQQLDRMAQEKSQALTKANTKIKTLEADYERRLEISEASDAM